MRRTDYPEEVVSKKTKQSSMNTTRVNSLPPVWKFEGRQLAVFGFWPGGPCPDAGSAVSAQPRESTWLSRGCTRS